jgi:hypothetical protein
MSFTLPVYVRDHALVYSPATATGMAGLSRGRFRTDRRTDGRSDDGRGGVHDLDALGVKQGASARTRKKDFILFYFILKKNNFW